MDTDGQGRPPKATDEQIIKHVQNEEKPIATTPEVAEELPIGVDAVRHRLNELDQRGEVRRSKVGRSVVWWVPD
jgi:predicted transcriptional regulator